MQLLKVGSANVPHALKYNELQTFPGFCAQYLRSILDWPKGEQQGEKDPFFPELKRSKLFSYFFFLYSFIYKMY